MARLSICPRCGSSGIDIETGQGNLVICLKCRSEIPPQSFSKVMSFSRERRQSSVATQRTFPACCQQNRIPSIPKVGMEEAPVNKVGVATAQQGLLQNVPRSCIMPAPSAVSSHSGERSTNHAEVVHDETPAEPPEDSVWTEVAVTLVILLIMVILIACIRAGSESGASDDSVPPVYYVTTYPYRLRPQKPVVPPKPQRVPFRPIRPLR